MNRVFSLAALLALAGTCVFASTIGSGTFAVNSQASCLYESCTDANVSALFVNLVLPTGIDPARSRAKS
jgi:hypothetical protein